jgi:hypothetical protein
MCHEFLLTVSLSPKGNAAAHDAVPRRIDAKRCSALAISMEFRAFTKTFMF